MPLWTPGEKVPNKETAVQKEFSIRVGQLYQLRKPLEIGGTRILILILKSGSSGELDLGPKWFVWELDKNQRACYLSQRILWSYELVEEAEQDC